MVNLVRKQKNYYINKFNNVIDELEFHFTRYNNFYNHKINDVINNKYDCMNELRKSNSIKTVQTLPYESNLLLIRDLLKFNQNQDDLDDFENNLLEEIFSYITNF